MCYLAAKWGLLPKLLQDSYVRENRSWGKIKHIVDDFAEPTEAKHLPFYNILWGLRNQYKKLTIGTIKALCLYTAEFMHAPVFELLNQIEPKTQTFITENILFSVRVSTKSPKQLCEVIKVFLRRPDLAKVFGNMIPGEG